MAFGFDTLYFGNTVLQYLRAFGVLVLAIILGRICYALSSRVLRRIASKTETKFDELFLDVVKTPFIVLLFIGGLYAMLRLLVLSDAIAAMGHETIRVLIILDVSYFIIKFADALVAGYLLPMAQKTRSDLDDHLVPIVRRFVKVALILIAGLMVLSTYGVNITSLVAGLGIGGLAFALAAQPLLANMFGGIAILSDKPFKIGDHVRLLQYEGNVKEIGLRTTRIRSVEGSDVIVPNAKITDSPIENVSQSRRRKVSVVVGLTYGTSTQRLERAMEILRDIVKNNEDTDDDVTVLFSEFGDYALKVTLVYMISNLERIAQAQNDINLEIKRRFEKEGIKMAFPTQTIEVIKR